MPNKALRFSTTDENGLRVENVELPITHFHTNAQNRYNLLIIVNKFRVEIDHSAGPGFESLIRHQKIHSNLKT